MTFIPSQTNQKTAFGELSVSEMTPQVQLQFTYNINASQNIIFPGNGGTITNGDKHANATTGTSADGFALLISIDALKYNSGQGALARFTGLFTTGVANSEQVLGIGNELRGLFFGYDGTSYGVLRRTDGSPEIRTLTITAGSSTAENITITLNGDVDATVAVTNSGDATVTAREIASHNFASLGTGWGAQVAGNKVTFISVEPTSQAGSYAIAGTTVAGTYAQTAAGVAPTDTWTAQASWNVDPMDGAGPSGQTIDATKGNVYQIRYQWLGYGLICFEVENSATGEFQVVHRIAYANNNIIPSLSNPTLPFFLRAVNKGSTTSITTKCSSVGLFTEGRDLALGPAFSTQNLFVIGNVITEEPVLTIRNKQIYQDEISEVRISPTFITLTSNLAAANSNTVFRTYLQATAENGTSYSDISTNSSVVEVDSSAVDFDTTDAQLQSTFLLDKTQSQIFDLTQVVSKIPPGTTFMITAQPSKANASNEVGATISWKELF